MGNNDQTKVNYINAQFTLLGKRDVSGNRVRTQEPDPACQLLDLN
jgi:hypothetical protein